MADDDVTGRASTLLELGRPDEALELLAPIAATSSDTGVHHLCVVALSQLGRADEAATAARHALDLVGPAPDLARVASYAFRAVGEHELALEVARAGVQAAPAWVPGLLALLYAELERGHRREAEAAIAQALALAPDEPSTHLAAADLLLALGRRSDARDACRTALRLDPTSVSALRALGVLHEQPNRYGLAAYGGASQWYARALLLRPGDPELTERVRALFGRMLGTVIAVAMTVNAFVAIAFMAQADPNQANQGPPLGLPEPLFWGLMLIGVFGLLGGMLWSNLRGTPRVVLGALRSETRVYRRVRRCWRLTLALAVSVLATVVAAVMPIGDPTDRLGLVVLLFVVAMALGCVSLIALVRTFGRGGMRAAAPGRRDERIAA